MSDRAALIRAVLDNPEDDTPRLVFADWLDEFGTKHERARAAFIRLQIEAERISLADGERERSEPFRRAQELLAEHGKRWRKQVRTYDGDYSRGFLCIERSPHEFAKDVRPLLALEPAEVGLKLDAMATLRGPDRSVEWFAEFAQNEDLRAVRELVSTDVRVQLDGPRFAALLSSPHLANVKLIDIRDTRGKVLGPECVRAIAESPSPFRLTGLSLEGTLSDVRESETLDAPEVLDAVRLLATSPRFAALESLSLNYNGIGEKGLKRLCASKTLPKRMMLEFVESFCVSEPPACLARLAKRFVYRDYCTDSEPEDYD